MDKLNPNPKYPTSPGLVAPGSTVNSTATYDPYKMGNKNSDPNDPMKKNNPQWRWVNDHWEDVNQGGMVRGSYQQPQNADTPLSQFYNFKADDAQSEEAKNGWFTGFSQNAGGMVDQTKDNKGPFAPQSTQMQMQSQAQAAPPPQSYNPNVWGQGMGRGKTKSPWS